MHSSMCAYWAHLCIAFCLTYIDSLDGLTFRNQLMSIMLVSGSNGVTDYTLRKIPVSKIMKRILLLWQVGLIANVKLHFLHSLWLCHGNPLIKSIHACQLGLTQEAWSGLSPTKNPVFLIVTLGSQFFCRCRRCAKLGLWSDPKSEMPLTLVKSSPSSLGPKVWIQTHGSLKYAFWES